jgi:hypothetical protein
VDRRCQKIIFDLYASAPHVNTEDSNHLSTRVQTMSERTPILVGPDVLEQLHDFMAAINRFRISLTGSARGLPAHANYTAPDGRFPEVVNGLYEKLDELPGPKASSNTLPI